MFNCFNCPCNTEVGYMKNDPSSSSGTNKIYCEMCFFSLFPGVMPEILRKSPSVVSFSHASPFMRRQAGSQPSSSSSSSSSEGMIPSTTKLSRITPCKFCNTTSHTILLTCPCEKTASCMACSSTKFCSHCRGKVQYNDMRQFQFQNTSHVPCIGCGSMVLMAHMKYHLEKVCELNDVLRQRFLKKLQDSSKVVSSLSNNCLIGYKRKLQRVYDDFGANPETESSYRLLISEEKRERVQSSDIDLLDKRRIKRHHR